MRVEVHLFATLARFLPPESREGRVVLDVPDGARAREVIQRLGIPPEFERVLLVNGHEADADAVLRADDVLTLFPPLAGGSRVSPSAGRSLPRWYTPGVSVALLRTGSV